MPTLTGYSRNEIIQIVLDMTGDGSSKFRNHMVQNFAAWQMEFFSLHDWNFAHNTPRCTPEPILRTIEGERCYSVPDIGSPTLNADQIESIVCISQGQGRKLTKTTLSEIRLNDPEGIQTGRPMFYFPLTMTEIELWPVPNVVEEFVVEGKFEANAAASFTNITDFSPLDIPYKYQDCFLQFIFCKGLRYQRDPRQKDEILIFKDQLRIAIAEDMRNLESNLRMKTTNETIGPPGSYDINYRLWNYY